MRVARKPAALRVAPANLRPQGSFYYFCLHSVNPRISARGAYCKFIEEKSEVLIRGRRLIQRETAEGHLFNFSNSFFEIQRLRINNNISCT